jgi:hypothetical protein
VKPVFDERKSRTMISPDELPNRAFQLAYFLHRERNTALEIVTRALNKLQLAATAQGVRFAPGGIRQGAAGFDICFVHSGARSREMARASGITLEIDSSKLRFLPGALGYAAAGAQPGGLANNRDFASCAVSIPLNIAPEIEALLYDPQTSGGLLLALPESAAAGLPLIGRVLERGERSIVIL